MHYSKATKVGFVLTAAVAGLVAMAQVPAAADGFGSDNTMFKRHFWRGQAYHGAGYHPQVSDIGRDAARSTYVVVPYDATVIDERG